MAEWHAKRGTPGPQVLTDKPTLHADLRPTWQAWQTLNLTRPVGMGISAIPWSELSQYASDHGMSGDSKLRFCNRLHAVDVAFVVEMAERKEAKRGSSGASSRREGSPDRTN